MIPQSVRTSENSHGTCRLDVSFSTLPVIGRPVSSKALFTENSRGTGSVGDPKQGVDQEGHGRDDHGGRFSNS